MFIRLFIFIRCYLAFHSDSRVNFIMLCQLPLPARWPRFNSQDLLFYGYSGSVNIFILPLSGPSFTAAGVLWHILFNRRAGPGRLRAFRVGSYSLHSWAGRRRLPGHRAIARIFKFRITPGWHSARIAISIFQPRLPPFHAATPAGLPDRQGFSQNSAFAFNIYDSNV